MDAGSTSCRFPFSTTSGNGTLIFESIDRRGAICLGAYVGVRGGVIGELDRFALVRRRCSGVRFDFLEKANTRGTTALLLTARGIRDCRDDIDDTDDTGVGRASIFVFDFGVARPWPLKENLDFSFSFANGFVAGTAGGEGSSKELARDVDCVMLGIEV